MPDTTAGDIRSVIKNATQWWIKRPDWLWNLKKSDWATWTGNTIATKQEIDTQRTSNTLNPRPSTPTATPTSSPIEALSNNVKSENSTIQATKNPLSSWFGGWSIFASQNTNPNEINNSGEKINDVEINWEKIGGDKTLPSRWVTSWTINSRIPEAQQQAKQKMQVELWNAVRDLYTTAYSKLQNGEYLTYDYVREKFPEFEQLSDEELYQLASDATYLAEQWDYNLQNAFELADAYGLDTALLFDELDPKTKWEYLTYLASWKTEQSPWLLDRVIGFWLDKLGVWWDATFQDYLNYQQDNYSQAKVKGKELQQSYLSDLRTLFNSYRNYYRADDKELNDMWKDIERYYKWELWDGWFGNAKWLDDILGGWDWYTALNSKVKWKDEEKKKEFKKAYNEWASKEKMGRIKNFGSNALYSLADLWVWAYSAANHLIDFGKWLLGLWVWAVENAAKGIWVMPEDTYSKLESTWPVGQWFSGIMKSSEESADMIWKDYIVDHYGSADKFVSALMDDPFGVWSDFTWLMELWLKSWAKLKIWNLWEKIPVKIGNKTVWKTRWWVAGEEVAKLDPAMWMMWAGFKADETILKAPLKAAEYWGKTIKWVGDVSGVNNFIIKLANQATWLTEEQRAFIRENPDLVQAYITGEKSIDDLTSEMIAKYGDEKAQRMIAWDLFDFLKKSDQQLDTRGMFYKLTDAFSELWATRLADWTIEFTKPLEESVKARIKKAYEYMDSISNWTASVNDVHWAREGIGWLTKWDAGHTMTPQESMLNAAMKDVYGTIGEVLKTQVRWWADADKAYTEISRILTDFKEWFDKDGNLKDSAYWKISNLMNKNNKPKLERLLKYFPQFEKDIKALSAAKAVDRAMNATAWQYINAAMSALWGGALFSLFTGWVWLGTVITWILAANYLTPRNFVKVLRAEWWLRRLAWGIGQKIIDKLASWKKLTEKESDAVYDYATQNRERLTKVADDLKKREELEKVDKKWALDKLEERRNELKKQLKEGKISRMEYNEKMDAIEYDISQLKTKYNAKDVREASKEKWDTEYVVSEEEGKRLKEKYITPLEKKLGFREDTEAALKKEVENAEKQWGSLRGYAKVKEKLYALTKNPTSTTAQHEFFHAVFSVVDEKSARYILNEAKRIMKEYWMTDLNAEERLAESFGTYAKRKDVKLWILDKPTTAMWKFRAAVNDLFQKAYEWIQNYNGDRKTINKMFNEILKDEWVLDANWKLDLSYLLDDTNPWWLKNKLWLESKASKELLNKSSKRWYKSSDLWWVTFKKDVTPKKPKDNWWVGSWLPKVRYKKDINGKEVQIDTKATSPDQLAKINTEWLSVMKSFISEKQADKALNVSKALLTKDGDAYLWTHTNKYDATPFTAFENAKDSKYKEFTNNEIAWFTNSKEMSNSYASEETKLADTKAPRTDAEFKDYLKKLWKKDEGKSYTNEVEFNIKKWDDGYYVERLDKWDNTYDDEWFRDYAAFYGGMTRWAYDVWEKALGGIDKVMEAFKQRHEKNNYINTVVERKNWKIHVHTELPSKESEVYKDKQWLYAGMYAERQGFDKYHYQGIIQDMKNPLVVDLGKYAKWEIRFWEKVEGQWRFWSDLWTAYDFIKKNTDADIDTVAKTIKDEFKKAVDNEDKIYDGNLMNAFQNERLPKVMEWKRLEKEWDYVEARKWSDEAGLISSAEHKIANLRYGIVEKLTPEEAKVQIGDKTVREIYNKSKKAYEKYKEIYDLWKEQEQTYRQDYPIWWGLVSDKYTRHTRNNFINYLKNKWIDEGAASMILHDTPLRLDKWWLASYDLAEMLKNKKLQTNDYVFYALRKGWYDGVIFKDIVDYGHLTEERKGGDVVAAFNSKQFKAWDNANPTDSKYISYKRDTGLNAKLPDTDNDGRKLSEAQRKFFAWTKVVDKNGNLLRVYHGTRGWDFTVFRKWNSWSNNLAKVWYWFTPNKEWALKFAEWSWGWDAKPRAEEVYLDIKNPKVYEPSKFNLLKNEERNAKIDEQRKVYNQKADKADWLDYTHAWWFFHDEFDHPYYDRAIFEYLKRSWDNDRKYDWKYWKYNPEEYRALADEWNRNRNANLDYDKILKDFEEYTKAKLDEEKEYSKLLDIKHNDPYDDFMYDIYKIDSNYDNKWTKDDLNRALNDYDSPNKFVDKLKSEWYDGIIIKWTEYDWEVIWWWARNDQYVAFDSNQIKRITNENPTKNDDIRFKKWYHWSPAKFDRFDSTHMWEWEGAQAHWWGHYIAIDKATAEKYAISRNSEYKGMPIEDFFKTKEWKVYSNIEKEAIRKVGEYIPTYTAEEAIEILPDDLYPPKTAYDRAVINAIQNLDPADFNSGRHLYDVDFKDPARKNTPSGWNYLDEETPYSRKTFDKIFEEAKKQGWDESKARNYIDDKLKFNGNDKMYGVWIRQALDMWFGEESWKKTSKFLESLGYDWIHYNWLQDGEAYVLFGDDTGKITNHVAFKKDVKGLGKKQDNDSWLRYKKARHGSPASFDKFDSSHMGEWEWAQVHWWGHYVAVNKETWLQYGKMWARKYQGKQIWWFGNLYDELYNSKEYSVDVVNAVKEIAEIADRENISIKDAKAKALERRKWWLKDAEERLEKAKKRWDESNIQDVEYIVKRSKILIDTMKDINEKDFNTRNLYELEIPDPVKRDTPTGTNYIEEEGKLSKSELNKMADAVDKKLGKIRKLWEITMDDVEKAAKYLGEDKLVEWVKENIKNNPWRTIKDALYETIRFIPDENWQKKYWMKDIQNVNKELWVNVWTTEDLRSTDSMNGKELYKHLSNMLWGDKEASKLLESLWYDGIHYFWWRDWEAYVLFSDNAPQITDHIRYKKGLQKKESWLQKKETSNVPQQSKTKIWNGISKMRNILKNAWIYVNNHTKDWPLKNAVKMITEMNKEKDKFKWTPNFNAMVQGREEGIMWILDAIDKGYNNENLHYKWFYDPKWNGWNTNSKNHPTVLIWEWDFNNALQTYKDFQNGLIKEDDLKLWAQHMDINSNTKGSIDKFRNPKWKLEVTPLRPRKRNRSK